MMPASRSLGAEYSRRISVLDLARVTKNAPAKCNAHNRSKDRYARSIT